MDFNQHLHGNLNHSLLNLADGTSWPATNGHVGSDGWVMEKAKPSKRVSHGSEQSPSVMRTGSHVNSGSRVNWAELSTAERNEIIGEDEIDSLTLI